VPSVTTDGTAGIRQAVAHFAAAGHTRSGYISGPQASSTGRERFAAFTESVIENGLSADPALVCFGDYQAASGSAGVHALLGLGEPPTALLVADSLMAVGAIASLHDRGVRLGVDLAMVAFDDIEWFALLNPALSVISHSVADMGRTAVDLLLQVIDGGTPASVVLPSELIVRASSASSATTGTAGTPATPPTAPTASHNSVRTH